MDENQVKAFDCWAIVELFGHNKIAGRLTTQTVGVAALFRVDVPEILVPEAREPGYDYVDGKHQAVKRVVPEHKRGGYTRFFGVGAIYAINPVSEETARAAVVQIEPLPVRERWFPVNPQIPQITQKAEASDQPDGTCPQCSGDLEGTSTEGVLRCTDCGMTIPVGKLNG